MEQVWAGMATAWANITLGMANIWEWLTTPTRILGLNVVPIAILGGTTIAVIAGSIIIKEAFS